MAALSVFGALALGTLMAQAQVNVYVDSTQPWIGYMNVFELPSNGGGYDFGSPWGTSALTAVFANEGLTIIPNTNVWETTDTYWVQADGVSPNKTMDASMYVQNDALAGNEVIFSGNCETYSLDGSYTCTAFIKDFSPGYALVNSTTMQLAAGTPFSINLTTAAGDHIQYGFETIGPDANPATVASLGEAVIDAPVKTNVTVSPITFLDGYVSWTPATNDPTGDGGYGASTWGVAALPEVLTNSTLTLSPNVNTYNAGSIYWVNPDGTGANVIDASFYAEFGGGLFANTMVSFTFTVLTNTLVYPYTADGWIKDFGPGYAFNGEVTSPNLTPGTYTVVYPATGNNAGEIVQYGFEVIGPDANPATVASLGQLVIAVPSTTNLVVLPANPVAIVGTSQAFTVTSTGSGLNYQWQYNGVNLTDSAAVSGATTSTLTLNNLQASNEGTYTVVASDSSSTNNAYTYLAILNPAHLTVDPQAPWIGYENWFYDSGGVEAGLVGQNVEPPAHLPAGFSSATLTLSPNTSDYLTNNAEFVNPDGSAAAIIEADYYVQDDALAGQTLTFVGYCPSNTLDTNYSETVFIEDFVPSYGSFVSADTTLVSGQPFSITLATTAGDHIEYGFKTVGPVANPTSVAALGQALASINPPTLSASLAGGVVNLSFPTETGLRYAVQYTSNLANGAWQTLSSVNGTASTVTVTDTTGTTGRFYRLSIQ